MFTINVIQSGLNVIIYNTSNTIWKDEGFTRLINEKSNLSLFVTSTEKNYQWKPVEVKLFSIDEVLRSFYLKPEFQYQRRAAFQDYWQFCTSYSTAANLLKPISPLTAFLMHKFHDMIFAFSFFLSIRITFFWHTWYVLYYLFNLIYDVIINQLFLAIPICVFKVLNSLFILSCLPFIFVIDSVRYKKRWVKTKIWLEYKHVYKHAYVSAIFWFQMSVYHIYMPLHSYLYC